MKYINKFSYETLFEQSNDGVILLDLEGNHLACNHRAVEILEYDSVAELAAAGYREVVAPEQITEADNVLARLLKDERVAPYERLFLKKDGTPVPVEINVQLVRDEEGNPAYVQSIIRDISRRKQRQMALQESELRFRTFFEHSPIAMWQLDYSGVADYIRSHHKAGSVRIFLEENPEIVNEAVKFLKIDDINQQVLHLYRVREKEELRSLLINNIKRDPITHERNREIITRLMEGKSEFELSSFMKADNDEILLNVVLRFKVFPGCEESLNRVMVSQTNISELTSLETRLAQSRATAREFQVYLTRLHNLTIRLGQLDTLDEIYQAAVTAARMEFGFSRAALFVADFEANLLRGTYGTSPDGELRPEHDYSEQLHPSEWFDSVRESRNRVTFWDDADLLEYGDSFATGWKAASALWSGDEVLGYIIVDNYLTAEPPRPYEEDLLSLFSTQLGNLVARRRSLSLLEQSQQLLDSTFASLTDAVFLLEKTSGLIEDCNLAATKLLGFSYDSLIGSFPDFILPAADTENTSIETLSRVILEKSDFGYFSIRHSDGSTIFADIHLTPLQIPDAGTTTGWVMVIHDMSERRAMEQEVINLALETERVTALRQLITNLRHDIATPLSSIKTNLYVIGKSDDEQKRKQRLNVIDTQVSIIQASLESVTEMVRVDILNEHDLDRSHFILNELLTSIFLQYRTQAQEKQQNLNLMLPPDSYRINVDQLRLRTAIEQVLTNALQFTPDNGTIDLSLSLSEGWVAISVKDTGIGISEEDRPYIFDRLYRGQRHRPLDGSAGIGLSIAKRLVELHGGYIQLESELDKGTTVFIYLPQPD